MYVHIYVYIQKKHFAPILTCTAIARCSYLKAYAILCDLCSGKFLLSIRLLSNDTTHKRQIHAVVVFKLI
jgi:hypothetical protein